MIEFTLLDSEVLELRSGISSLSLEQELLMFMKDEKGLVCKGKIILKPKGELTWWYNNKVKGTHYKQRLTCNA